MFARWPGEFMYMANIESALFEVYATFSPQERRLVQPPRRETLARRLGSCRNVCVRAVARDHFFADFPSFLVIFSG